MNTGVFVLRYFPSPENFVVGKLAACTIVYLPDVQFSVVNEDIPMSLDVRSPRPDQVYKGAVLSNNRSMAFKVFIYRGTYVMQKLPGRHVLYVWALEATQFFGALEPVELRVVRTGPDLDGLDCLAVCC